MISRPGFVSYPQAGLGKTQHGRGQNNQAWGQLVDNFAVSTSRRGSCQLSSTTYPQVKIVAELGIDPYSTISTMATTATEITKIRPPAQSRALSGVWKTFHPAFIQEVCVEVHH